MAVFADDEMASRQAGECEYPQVIDDPLLTDVATELAVFSVVRVRQTLNLFRNRDRRAGDDSIVSREQRRAQFPTTAVGLSLGRVAEFLAYQREVEHAVRA